MKAMKKDRVISSTIMILVTVAAITNTMAFNIVLISLICAGLYEFFHMMQIKKIPVYSYTGIVFGLLIPVSLLFQPKLTGKIELAFIVLVLLLIFLLQMARNNNKDAIVGISTTLFGVLYVSWFFSFLLKTKFLLPGKEGEYLVGFVLLVTKMGDIGALAMGLRYGKHPLLPRISPNKTIEGSIGSFVFSIAAAVLAQGLLPASLQFSFWHIVMMGAFLGGIGQLGDLSESMIKRDCQVKDSGKILPGLGGVLDTIDSVLFTAPVFYFYMSSVLNVG